MSMWILLSAVLTASVAQAVEMPVIISDLVTGASSHVRVTNTSSQPVTAWSIAATTRTPNGTHREVYTTDGYLSDATHGLPGAAERLERLMPGQSRQLSLDPLPEGARVEVVAAVMDDGTAVGDDTLLTSIFATRARERDALRTVVDAFNEVLAVAHGGDALAALKERFATLVQRDRSVPCRAALEAVETYERKGSAGQIDRSLRTYADFVTREYKLAEKHAARKSP